MLQNQIRTNATSNAITARRVSGAPSAMGREGGVEGDIGRASGARDFTAFAVATSVLNLAHAAAIGYHARMSDIRTQESVTERCCAVQCARTQA